MSSSFFRAIDIFDKFDNEELRLRTKTGGFLSILLTFFGALFFAIKTVRYLTPKVYRDLSLTPALINQQDFVNISVSVEVDLPCYFLHLDAIDTLGFSQLDINSTANLRRLTRSGKFIDIANLTLKEICHSCFGVLPDNACCNSCEQLILLFVMRGMPPRPDVWPQCKANGAPPQVSLDEKCLIKGKVSVNKVPGNFHIAPGRNLVGSDLQGHQHDLSFKIPSLELSHRIERIRFGPSIPTANTPLTGISVKQKRERPMLYKYNLLATPLVYIKNGKEKSRGYEYTAMITNRPVFPGLAPGIFFDYSFTPYGVVVNSVSRSFPQYLTSTFGFLSGSFAVVMMLDLFLQNTKVIENIKKPKPEIVEPEPEPK